MLRKLAPVIYIFMIILGIAGFMYSSSKPIKTEDSLSEKKKIMVPVSTSVLNSKGILTKDDYYYEEIEYDDGAKPDVFEKNIDGWGIRKNIAKKSIIRKSDIIDPESDEYISLILKNGHVFKSIAIANDTYTAITVKPGDYLDIFLSYSKKINSNNKAEIISPPENLKDSSLSKVISKTRVMSVKRGPTDKASDIRVIIELTPDQEKKLEQLETSKAKIIAYFSSDKKSMDWPLANSDVMNKEKNVKEYRGDR